MYLNASLLGSKFKSSLTPWIREPMEAFSDGSVREITTIACVQGSKTTFELGCMTWAACNDPGPTYYVAQTDDDAKDFAKDRAWPSLEALGVGQLILPTDRTKRAQTYVAIPGGWIRYLGANKKNLSSKPCRYVFNDEVWLWASGLLQMSRERTTRAWNRKVMNASTFGTDGDDLDLAFHAGDMRIWKLACPLCGQLTATDWNNVKWSPDCKRGNGYDFAMVKATVYFECDQCQGRVENTQANHVLMNEHARYVVTNPGAMKENVSFAWNALCLSPAELSLGSLACEFLGATIALRQGNTALMRDFYQKRLCRNFDDKLEDSHTIPCAVETTGWADPHMLIMTVDVQQTHFWVLIRAWSTSRDGRSRGVWYARAETWLEVEAKANEYKVHPGCVFVDSSFDTMKVYAECAFRNRIVSDKFKRKTWEGWTALNGEAEARKSFVVKGARGQSVVLPHSEARFVPAKEGMAQKLGLFCKMILWSNLAVKDITARLRDGKGAEWLGVPENELWHEQQFSERKVRVTDNHGRSKYLWEPKGRAENHAWDCENMNTVAALRFGLIGSGEMPDKIAAEDIEDSKLLETQSQ